VSKLYEGLKRGGGGIRATSSVCIDTIVAIGEQRRRGTKERNRNWSSGEALIYSHANMKFT